MAKYQITDNKTGKKFILDWQEQEPPTELDIQEAISSLNPPSTPEIVARKTVENPTAAITESVSSVLPEGKITSPATETLKMASSEINSVKVARDLALNNWMQQLFKNIGTSSVELGKNVVTPLLPQNLPKTVESLGRTGIGVGENITQGTSDLVNLLRGKAYNYQPPSKNQAMFNALVDFYKNRYGSIPQVKNTLYKDPAGAVSDIASLLTLGGGVTGINKLVKVGNTVDPAVLAMKGIGKTIEKVSAPFKGFVNQKMVESVSELNKILEDQRTERLKAIEQAQSKTINSGDKVNIFDNAGAIKGTGTIDSVVGTSTLNKPIYKVKTDIPGIGPYELNVPENLMEKIPPTPEEIVAANQKVKPILMPASSMSSNRLVRTLEDSFTGYAVKYKTLDEMDNIHKRLDDITKTLEGTQTSRSAMNDIRNGYRTVKDALYDNGIMEIYKNEYIPNKIKIDIDKNVSAANTHKLIDSYINKYSSDSQIVRELQILKDNIFPPGPITNTSLFEHFMNSLHNIEQVKLKVPSGIDTSKILSAMRQDLKNTVYKSGIKSYFDKNSSMIKSKEIEKIINGIDSTNRILGGSVDDMGLFDKRTTAGDIKSIMDSVDPVIENVQSMVIDSILKKSRNEKTGKFISKGVSETLKNIGDDKLNAIFGNTPRGQKTIGTLKRVGDITDGLDSVAKLSSNAASASIYRLLAELGTMVYRPGKAALLVIGDSAMQHFISSKWGKKWMTEGYGKAGQIIQKSAPVTGRIEKVTEASE